MAKTLDMHTEQVEILARIVRAEERVQLRLIRVSGLLAKAKIPYAVIGGHAVAAWVATKDESLVSGVRKHVEPARARSLSGWSINRAAAGFASREKLRVDGG
jgi:hypothetical protein